MAAAIAIADLEDVRAEEPVGQQVRADAIDLEHPASTLHRRAVHVVVGHEPTAGVDFSDDPAIDLVAGVESGLARDFRTHPGEQRVVVDRPRVERELVEVVRRIRDLRPLHLGEPRVVLRNLVDELRLPLPGEVAGDALLDAEAVEEHARLGAVPGLDADRDRPHAVVPGADRREAGGRVAADRQEEPVPATGHERKADLDDGAAPGGGRRLAA